MFLVLNFFFPPPGLGEEAPFVDDALYGVDERSSESNDEKNLAIVGIGNGGGGKQGAVMTVSV